MREELPPRQAPMKGEVIDYSSPIPVSVSVHGWLSFLFLFLGCLAEAKGCGQLLVSVLLTAHVFQLILFFLLLHYLLISLENSCDQEED